MQLPRITRISQDFFRELNFALLEHEDWAMNPSKRVRNGGVNTVPNFYERFGAFYERLSGFYERYSGFYERFFVFYERLLQFYDHSDIFHP